MLNMFCSPKIQNEANHMMANIFMQKIRLTNEPVLLCTNTRGSHGVLLSEILKTQSQ